MQTDHHCQYSRFLKNLCFLGFLTIGISACGTRPIIQDDIKTQSVRQSIVTHAMNMQGKPYRYGGADPGGFDCSGLVQYSYQKAGIKIPRTTYQQFRSSSPLYDYQLKLGDLVFFRINNSIVSHVGIFIGQGRFIHAPGSGRNVKLEAMHDPYWEKHFVGAGTMLE